MNIKVEIEGYHTIPEGSTTVAHTWSGDMINAQYYLPEGTGPEVLAYWQPPTAVIQNDTHVRDEQGQEPGAGAPVHRPPPRQGQRRERTSRSSATSRPSRASAPRS